MRSQDLRPVLSSGGGLSGQLKVHGPRAPFVSFGPGASWIVSGSSTPLPSTVAEAATCRRLKALPTTSLGYYGTRPAAMLLSD